jgi:tetratricopeptide (TPR) repeat protein
LSPAKGFALLCCEYPSGFPFFGFPYMVIYELLTGEVPFKGDYESAVMYAVLNENVEPADDKNLPEELLKIINKCLSKNPADRYQNADEIKDDISLLKEESSVKQTRKIHSDKKRYLKIAIPVLVAIIAVVVLFFVAQEAESTAPIPIAVVDFINETGENELDGLSGMLTTALEQSRRLSVITRSHMFDILKQLDKENVDYIDENLGREIAIHANIKVLVIATIRKFDQMYNIDLKVIDPIEDKYLFADKVDGEGKAKISPMIDQLAENTREGLEESEEEIKQTATPVAQITTPILEAYHHYYNGQEYIDKYLFREAEQEFTKAIELDSTFGLAYYRLAYAINYWENNLQRAKEPINKAFRYIDNIPPKEKYLVRFVKTSIDSGWGEAALKILREMEKVYPNDKEMIYNIGDIFCHIGKFKEAKKYLEKVLQIDPNSARALHHLTWVYVELKDHDQMLESAKKYVSIFDNLKTYQFLVRTYNQIKEFDKVYEILKREYELNPDDAELLFDIVLFLFDRRLHDQAVAYFNKIEEKWPDYWNSLPVADSYTFRGHINMYAGNFEEAEKDFNKAFTIDPKDVLSLDNYEYLLLALKRYDEVKEIAAQYQKNTLNGRYYEAVSHAVNGDKEKALNIDLGNHYKRKIYLLLEMKDESVQLLYDWDNVLIWERSYYTGLTNWPMYDFLRDDPRFQEIVARHKQVHDKNLRKYGDLIDLIKE